MPLQPSGDQLVDAKSILEAIAELKRRGNSAIMQELESIERELAGYLMEELGLIHHGLLKTGAKNKLVRQLNEQIESLALVSILSLRKAYFRLMEEGTEETPPARIDAPGSQGTPHPTGGESPAQ
jgi:hypothetical protein